MNLFLFRLLTQITIIVSAFILYNFSCIIYYFYKFKRNNSNYYNKNINNHKKILTFLTPLFIIFLILFFYSSRPLTFKNIIGNYSEKDITKISAIGNFSEGYEEVELNPEAIKNFITILNKYKYKRTFWDDFVGGDVILLNILNNSSSQNIFIEIRDGYIRIPNDKVYKIIEDNDDFLLNELLSLNN